MTDSPNLRASRPEVAAAAAGGGVGAALTYVAQVSADLSPHGGPAALPAATFAIIAAGSLVMGGLLGVLRERRPRWATAAVMGFLCGATPLACYAAVGLTIRSRSGSVVFLVGTPLVAFAAGAAGFLLATVLTRRSRAGAATVPNEVSA